MLTGDRSVQAEDQKTQEPGAHDARLPVQPSPALSANFVNEG
jgi:hypothetical protein